MKISAIAGTVMFGFAALFKIMHWPGAGILLTLGGLSLAFIFMPSALGVLWKETHNAKKLFLYISAFLAVMFFVLGVVFKVQHWLGAAIVLSLSALCGVLLFIPALLTSKLRDPDKKSKRIVYILGAAGLIVYILGLLCKIQHWPFASILLEAGTIVIFLVVFPWYTWITWKDDRNISARFIFMVIGSMALLMPGLLINLNLQRNYDAGFFRQQNEQQALFQYKYMNNQLLISHCNDTALMQYSDYLSGLLKIDDFDSYMRLLDPTGYLHDINPETERLSFMAGMHMLELMKNGILTEESHALSTVSELNNQ